MLPRYLDPMQCPCAEAKIPAVLRYLDGCKHFDPKGRWVRTPALDLTMKFSIIFQLIPSYMTPIC